MPARRTRLLKRLATEAGLVLAGPEALTIVRERRGRGFCFRDCTGALICDKAVIARLHSLAVPPVYARVRYAEDPRCHLQALGEDAAGRLQYRYHPDWEKVREALKARRLASLAKVLPLIRRAVGRGLASEQEDLNFAVCAVVELASTAALRAGGESYARERGTRGATTLLKSNVRIEDGQLSLTFKGKGGKKISKSVASPRLIKAVERLKTLPGPRLFQYQGEDSAIKRVHAADVNAFLKRVTGKPVTLKDFRTLVATVEVLEMLMSVTPAAAARARRSQAQDAIKAAAEVLANTPTVARKSYVHMAVVTAFENGELVRAGRKFAKRRSMTARVKLLSRIMARHTIEVGEEKRSD